MISPVQSVNYVAGPDPRSGIQRGDIIVDCNGSRVEDSRQLSLTISQTAPGTTLRLTLLRDGKLQKMPVTLVELPAKQESGNTPNDGGSGPHLGVSVETMTPQLAGQLGLPSGTTGAAVSNVEAGSAAEEAGLQLGDVIQQVNRKPIVTADEFLKLVRAGGNQPVLLLIDRGGNHTFLMVTPH